MFSFYSVASLKLIKYEPYIWSYCCHWANLSRGVMGGNGKHERTPGVAEALRGFPITSAGLTEHEHGFQEATTA